MNKLLSIPLIVIFFIMTTNVYAAPSQGVAVASENGRYSLRKNGKSYFIKGAGGTGSLETLKVSGGNSIRTWGTDQHTPLILDYANKLKLSVTLGLWLAPARSFDYKNTSKRRSQLKKISAQVQKFKDHPALLIWGVGNEVELGFEDSPEVWQAIDEAAAAVKKIDPNHPTMIVIADIGKNGLKIKRIKEYCPNIDIIGINSYDGALSLTKRLKKVGLDRPYVLTEYGAIKKGRTKWGADIEMTGTERANYLTEVYQAINENKHSFFGSYVFIWGSKRERTETFFGLFLDNNTPTNLVELMRSLWRNDKNKNRCPVIDDLSHRYIASQPSEKIDLQASVTSKRRRGLQYSWTLKTETSKTFGGATAKQAKILDNLIESDNTGLATLTMPNKVGNYRLYFVVKDVKNCATTASIPVSVKIDKNKF